MSAQQRIKLRAPLFQSPRSGKFESNWWKHPSYFELTDEGFQSPKSGKFESNSRARGRLHRDV